MLDIERISEWRGEDVIDPDGQRVGRLEEIYYDNYAESPGFACVKTGLFGRRLTFVPLVGASVGRDHVRVAYPADQIKHAPSVEPDGELTPIEEAALFEHYGLDTPIYPEPQLPPASPRLMRYHSEAAAAHVAQAVADQRDLAGGPALDPATGAQGATIDADRLSALEQRVAALESWRGG